MDAPVVKEYFQSAMSSLGRFTTLKSLHIQFPDTAPKCTDNRSSFKWKLNLDNRIESFLFLWPNSIRDKNGVSVSGNGNGDEEENTDMALHVKKVNIGLTCMVDATVRSMMSLGCIVDLPLLENVSCADSGKRGKLSLRGESIAELRKLLLSPSEKTVEQKLNRMNIPNKVHQCNLPLLELPISGYVMKGISFVVVERDVLGNFKDSDEIAVEWDAHKNENNGFEDDEEAAYSEAVMEILSKHRGLMERLM